MLPHLHDDVDLNLTVTYEVPDETYDEVAIRFIRLLYGDDTDELFTKTRDGRKMMTPWRRVLEEIAQLLDLRPGGEFALRHTCVVMPGSREHEAGMELHGPCCKSRAESTGKAKSAVTSFVSSRAWLRMCPSRWTHVDSTSRRFCQSQG